MHRVGLAFTLSLVLAGCRCGGSGNEGEICTNSIDDDADGTIDCQDSECRDGAGCQGLPEACFNGLDDDLDGSVDCADSDCDTAPGCDEVCDNGTDDNGNGLVDCDDAACAGVDPSCGEVCGNGEDDDGDGDFDCADSDCTGVNPPCGAGPDGSTCAYGGDAPHTCECADGTDNDGDANTDATDIHCFGPLDDDETTFSTGIPGDNNGSNGQFECPFDGNSGTGNDGVCCNLDDPMNNATPNGCDDTGCCEIDVNGNTTGEHVRISGTCDFAPACSVGSTFGCFCMITDDCDPEQFCVLDDDTGEGFCSSCEPCAPNVECENTCACAEICFGGFAQPDDACGGGMTMTCPTGVTECPTGTECDATANETCVTGCCYPTCPAGVLPCAISSDCPAGAGLTCVTGCCVLIQ